MDKELSALKLENNEKLISELQERKHTLQRGRIRGLASACVEVALIVALGVLICTTPVSSFLFATVAVLMGISSVVPITSFVKIAVKMKSDIKIVNEQIFALKQENKELKEKLVQSAELLKTSKIGKRINKVELVEVKNNGTEKDLAK